MPGEQAADRVQQLVVSLATQCAEKSCETSLHVKLTSTSQESFHTLLDEALIVAIASDHDLKTKKGYAAASSILKDLAQDVPSEEASGFNPSGFIKSVDDESNETKDTQTVDSAASTSQRQSVAHNTDSSAPDEAASAANATWSAPRVTLFNDDSEHGKLLQLRGMFPDLKEYDVNYAFRNANGDFQNALDDLLNIQYLQATGQQIKGVDGFFHPETQAKSKSKSKRRKAKSTPGTPSSSDANDDILSGYIKEAKGAQQTLPRKAVESFQLTRYHRASGNWLHCRALQPHV